MKSPSPKLTLQAIAKLLGERLSPIEEKLSQHDGKFDSIFDKLNEHDKKFDSVMTKLYEHDMRFDSIENNMATKADVNILHSGIDVLCTITSNLETEFRLERRVAVVEKN